MNASFLKWAGSKRSALGDLFKVVPKEGSVLVEPFVGSATVALNTDYDRYILNDINTDLINLYKMVVSSPDKFLKLSEELFVAANNERHSFLALRERYNQSVDIKERAVLFVYLNRHCFNGLMRYNKSGLFNVSFGDYRKPAINEDSVRSFSEKFKHARFTNVPFQSMRLSVSEDTVVYCDPPYLPKSATASFASYSQLGFKKEDHVRLDRKCATWKKKGAQVFVSNHHVPLLNECYASKVSMSTFFVSRTISCDVGNRTPTKEVVMSY